MKDFGKAAPRPSVAPFAALMSISFSVAKKRRPSVLHQPRCMERLRTGAVHRINEGDFHV
jgi:hypothetical protein